MIFNAMLDACHKEQLSVMGTFKHDFYPQGMTAVVVLGESHFSIHTYPESDFIMADAFTCGDADPRKLMETFRENIKGEFIKFEMLDRESGHHEQRLIDKEENEQRISRSNQEGDS